MQKIQLKILTLCWAHKSIDEDSDDERAKVLNFNKHLMVFLLIFNSWYEAVCMLQVVELKLYVSIVFRFAPPKIAIKLLLIPPPSIRFVLSRFNKNRKVVNGLWKTIVIAMFASDKIIKKGKKNTFLLININGLAIWINNVLAMEWWNLFVSDGKMFYISALSSKFQLTLFTTH